MICHFQKPFVRLLYVLYGLTMKILVIYESTRGRTKAMATAIVEGVTSNDGEAKLINAKDFEALDDACALAIGSSTRMKKPLPMVRRVLSELPDLNGLPAVAFGSYGWSGEAPGIITDLLRERGATIVRDPIRAKDFPSDEILEECKALGVLLSERCAK